jgi:hypothetical protein
LQDASPAIGRGLEIGNAAAGYCLVTGKPRFACDSSARCALTGLVAGIAVYSMLTALTDGDAGCAEAVKPPARNQLEFISTNGYGS